MVVLPDRVTKIRCNRVDIAFQTRRLERTFNSERELQRVYGNRMARTIESRLAVLEAAGTLSEAGDRPALRLHQLTGGRRGRFAVDLVHPYRLILRPNHSPVPLKGDGGIDTAQVTAITIMEVVDYH